MHELIWSDGSKVERSSKNSKPSEIKFKQTATKREDVSNRISERELVGKSNYNPFLTGTSYVDDLEVQENFLIPRSSHEK